MAGLADLIIPAFALGTGAVAAKAISATAPIIRGAIAPGGGTFTPNAPSSASTFFQSVLTMLDPNELRTSPNGIQFIKDREGFSPQAYWDVSQYSIGYGHKIHGGDGLTPRSVITENQATQLLYTDLAQVENVIKRLVTVALSQGQFDALSDFVYNLGAGNFQSSTLLQKLNAGDYAGAAEEFKRWIYAGGKPSVNLISRRTAEANIFTGIA